jgi:hypothetical protein
MSSQTSEYLPEARQGLEQFNTKEKSFELVRAKDPDQHVILRARDAVTTDPALTDGARNMFTFLLDLSLNPSVNNGRRGQIAISNTQLCERLSRSSRSIYGWTKKLEEQRHIWVSKLPRPNMHAMNVFHITALQPKREIRQEVTGDGMWGNGYRRPGQAMPLGARGATCKKRHYLVDRFGNPLFAQVLDNQAPTRKEYTCHPQNLREAPAKKDTCHPQNLREEPAKIAGGTRKKEHLAPAKNNTPPQQKPAVLRESQIEIETPVLRGEGQRPPSRAAWEKKLEKLYPDELRGLKAELIKQQREVDAADLTTIADFSLRIEAIDRQLFGAAVPRRKQQRTVAVAKPGQKAEPTQEDILEGARYLVSIGKGNLLTAGQREVLAKGTI